MIKKKILKIIIILIALILMMQIHSMAAVIVSTDKQVETDSGTVTISVTAKQSLGAYTLQLTDTAGLTLLSASAGDNTEISTDNKKMEGSYPKGTTSLGSFTFKVPSVTKDTKYNIKFSLTGMETPDLKKLDDETNTAVLTVKAKQTTPPTTTTPETPTTPATPTEPEPTFSSVNETVYATGTVNIREGYNTSSKIIGSLKKGEEVTRTGVGSNGWSKVTYNGKTAYISSSYLTKTKPVEEEKSNNANLKSLVVENQEIIPSFSTATLAYTMQVTNDITNLNINAEAEDEKATVSIQGNTDLKEGENLVTISVSAEDGTIKIYEIKVTKLPQTTLGLQSLMIKGTNIANEFKPDIYEYEIQIEDLTKLEIEAEANDETATVEIIGNEDLQEGENIITIMVSSQDDSEKVTYQIKVNKLAINKIAEIQEDKMDSNIYMYIAIGVIVFIALVIVIVYTIKHRNQEEYEEDNFEGFPGELPERQEEKQNGEKSKLDYFLDTKEDNDTNNRRGKHF